VGFYIIYESALRLKSYKILQKMLHNLLHKTKRENMVLQIDSGYIEYVIREVVSIFPIATDVPLSVHYWINFHGVHHKSKPTFLFPLLPYFLFDVIM
jgi:hypothetical protein